MQRDVNLIELLVSELRYLKGRNGVLRSTPDERAIGGSGHRLLQDLSIRYVGKGRWGSSRDLPNWGYRYFVAHVAQISRGNAQANAVNSTDLVWSRLVRDQEVGGSNPFAPTIYLYVLGRS